MKLIKNNLVPLLLTVAVTIALFFVLSYISYDINTYKPETPQLTNMLKGRVETEEFVAINETETLDEFYQAPQLTNEQPEIPLELFKTDDTKLYKWLGLKKPIK